MKYSNIPSISITEKELYQKNTSLDTISTIGMMLSDYGPARVEILITNEDDLISVFGEPNEYNYKFWWNAWNYLQYGSSLSLIRCLSNDVENYSLKLNDVVESVSEIEVGKSKNLYNSKIALMTLFQYNTRNVKLEVFNKYVTKSEDVAVAICSSEENFTKPISNEKLEHIIRNKDVSSPPENPINGERYSILKEKYIIQGLEGDNILTLIGNKNQISKNEKIQIKSFETKSWQISTSFVVGDLILKNDYIYECTVSGKTNTVEPVWTTNIGDSFSDNEITWICKTKDYRFDEYYSVQKSEYFASENYTNLTLNETPSQLVDLLTNIDSSNTYDEELKQPSGNEIGNDGWKVFIREEGATNYVFEGKENYKGVWSDFGNLTISIKEYLTTTTLKLETTEDLSGIPTDGSANFIINGSTENDGYYIISNVDNVNKILTFANSDFSISSTTLGDALGYWTLTALNQNSGDFVKTTNNNNIKQYVDSNFGWENVLEETKVEYLYDDFNIFIDDGLNNIEDYDVLEYQDGWNYYNDSHIVESYTTYIELLSSAFNFDFTTKTWAKIEDIEYYSVDENNDGIGEYAVRRIYSNNIYNVNKKIRSFKDLTITTPDWTNEFVILIFKKDNNGFFDLEEKYICSYDSSKKDFNNKSKFAEDLINDVSNLIYIKVGEGEAVDTYNIGIENLIIKDTSSILNYSNTNNYSVMNEVAIELLEDPNIVSGNILLGFSTNNNGNSDMSIMPRIANVRENAVCILSPWEESDYLGLSEIEITEKLISHFGVNYFGEKLQDYNSYTSIYGNMKLQQDKFTGKPIWTSLIGDIAGIYTRNDRDYDFSLSPAGSERAVLQNTLSLLYNPLSESQSKLEYEGINPVIFENYTGNFILNNAITSTTIYESIFRELHVRRLIIEIKRYFNIYFHRYMFKLNTGELRRNIENNLNQYFDEMIEKNQLQEFLVICDERNNTADVLNSNGLVVDISIRPFKTIKHIKISVNAIQNTLTFSEDEFL